MNNKTAVYAALAIVVVIAAGVIFTVGGHGGNANAGLSASGSTTVQSSGQNGSGAGTFSSSQYAPYSYLISQSPLSQQARSALSGFRLASSPLTNGSTQYVLTYAATGTNQTIVLKPNYKLYFIETTFGDDPFGGETALGDDGYIVVDPAGNIA
ncbi:MAG TPA: hypothetical protein VMV00_01905 [Candidatus Baltobacteraceae bacterium]|nr:hypothetical protein [Candidatus Baltobacteraceae bacterium]